MVSRRPLLLHAAGRGKHLILSGGWELADFLLFQGFEKADEHTDAQEWLVQSYVAGVLP